VAGRIGGARIAREGRERGGYDRSVRFPVVLFDLDGTVVDSGAIILASMRHATRSVLGREIPDEALMTAVGGPGLEAQMLKFGGEEHLDELIRVYRAHNEPLHRELLLCPGMGDVLVRLRDEGRRLGVVSAKRHSTVELAFSATGVGRFFEVVVGGDETARQKPAPDPLLLALERLGAEPSEAVYVGDSPFDISAAKAAGLYAIGVTWGGVHSPELLVDADLVVDTAEELLAAL
jgi:pyrophosphatase PpaX